MVQYFLSYVSIEAVGVAIAAPPTDGQANADLVLELKRREAKSFWTRAPDPEKIVKVTGSLTPEQVLDRLTQEASR
ncbi:unnamed protein product [Coregonus sp. 'balchen']|nr:unnamed protein product [Coregonus sp. 'balchen']